MGKLNKQNKERKESKKAVKKERTLLGSTLGNTTQDTKTILIVSLWTEICSFYAPNSI